MTIQVLIACGLLLLIGVPFFIFLCAIRRAAIADLLDEAFHPLKHQDCD